MTFRIATFNALNLNAPGHGFIGRPDEGPFTAGTFATRTERTVAVLDRLNADIVGFQEVFSEAALKQVVARSVHLADAAVLAPGAVPVPGAVGQDGLPVSDGPYVGIASRFPILRHDSLPNFPEGLAITVPVGLHDAVETMHLLGIRGYERPLLRAEIDVPGLPGLVVLVAHLKSKRHKLLSGEDENDPVVKALGALRSLIVRAAEAAGLRAQILRERETWIDGRRRPVIVLGDLNDDLRSVTTGIILGDRPRGFFKADRADFARMTRPLMISAFDLRRMPDGTAYSYVFGGTASLIDHILLSADFAPVKGLAQRARVTATGIDKADLPEPGDRFQLPVPSDLDAEPPPDPLIDAEPKVDRDGPKQKFDHGFPFADIEVLS
jgi:endonuclease/exonuclease/phosphatase family metal-dependent hydrolase